MPDPSVERQSAGLLRNLSSTDRFQRLNDRNRVTMSTAILRISLAAPVLALSLAACTSEQVYNAGQGWRQSQCNKNLDKAEYDRCMGQANTPYGTYKRETQPDKKQ